MTRRKDSCGAISTRPPFLTGNFNQEQFSEENKKAILGPSRSSIFEFPSKSVMFKNHQKSYEDLEVESVLSLQPEKLDLNMLRL